MKLPAPSVPPKSLPAGQTRFEGAMRFFAGALPAALAAAGGAATAAHDEGTIRAAGIGFTGIFRALDVLVASIALVVPIGGRGARAALAPAAITALCGVVLFDVTLALVRQAVPAALARLGLAPQNARTSPRLLAAVSAAAVATGLLAPAWQNEASAPGGAVTGALIVLLALRLETVTAPSAAILLGLAASYEPMVLVATAAALAPHLRTVPRGREAMHAGVAFAIGLVPLVLGALLARRIPEVALAVPWVSFGSPDASGLAAFVNAEVGTFLLVAAAAGTAMAFVPTSTRAGAAPLALVSAVGLASVASRTGSPASVLAGLLAVHALAALALAGIVIALSRARVPFAEASAALVVVLELALPVRAADGTMSRREARAPFAASLWNDVAWESAPPAAVLLVREPIVMKRIAAARALGEMRPDLVVVPTFDPLGRAARRALALEPKLAPFYRDVALGVAPEELSFADLSAQRAVLTSFDPKWERAFSRHLVPVGLTTRFEPEPRGASERLKAFDAFTVSRSRLVRVSMAKKDPALAQATSALLRGRALAMAATGERDMLSRALDDLRAFSPNDPLEGVLVRKMVTSKGAIDVHDMNP